MQLLILQGIPGSGKSTYAREFVKGKADWIRVSGDDLRAMRGDYWTPQQEEFITSVEHYAVIIALETGFNVLVDATNLNPKVIEYWKQMAELYSVEIEFKRFDITLIAAIERDALRSNPVGAKVIKNFFYKYIYKEDLPHEL